MYIIVKTTKMVVPTPPNNAIPTGIFQALKEPIAIAINMMINAIIPNIDVIPSFITMVNEAMEMNDNRLAT